MPRPVVVLVSSVMTYDGVPHAGGRYLGTLLRLLESETDLTFVSSETRVNRAGLERMGAPQNPIMVGLRPGRTLLERAVNRVVVRADPPLRRLDPVLPYLPLLYDLLRSRRLHRAISGAEVIDLQWFDAIRLARVYRWMNPSARLVGTFHDVQSQGFDRRPSHTRRARAFWRFTAWRLRRLERNSLSRLDEAIVFSRKDALLLGDPPHCRVVNPPLATGHEMPRTPPPGPPTAVFVSFLSRAENDDAARWLLSEIWPLVRARVPAARLRLVGSGASCQVLTLAKSDPSVVVTGFVDDLDAEYASAWACVVPLRQGAGVKFKTVEGLLRGVPTIATSVGAEGIDGPDLFAGVNDQAPALADALCRALLDPHSENARAARALEWAREVYGWNQFATSIRSSW